MPSKTNHRLSGGKDGVSSQNARDHLIGCADAILAEAGYGGLTISAVCKRAQVSPPSLYWHFGSKEGLLAAMLKDALRRDAQTFANLDTTGQLPHQALDPYLGALRTIVLGARLNSWVMLSSLSEARFVAPEVVDIIAEARRRQVDYNAEQLRAWGLRHNRVLVHLWLSYCNYIALLYHDTKSEELLDEGIASFKRIYLEALKGLGEACAREKDFGDMLAALGGNPASHQPVARVLSMKSDAKAQMTGTTKEVGEP